MNDFTDGATGTDDKYHVAARLNSAASRERDNIIDKNNLRFSFFFIKFSFSSLSYYSDMIYTRILYIQVFNTLNARTWKGITSTLKHRKTNVSRIPKIRMTV